VAFYLVVVRRFDCRVKDYDTTDFDRKDLDTIIKISIPFV
jgi:hypothetical protein